MNKSYPTDPLRNLLEPAQNILVLMPSSANFDQVAAALALFLSLAKQGKQVSILSSEEMRVEFSHLVGVDKVTDKIPSGDLVLTIDAPIENVEKVSYHEEAGKLHLVVKSKPGLPLITSEKILFSQGGGSADLLFVVETRKLENLGKIYQENLALFKEKPVVHLSHYPKAESFGQLSVIDPQASCACEIVAGLLEGLNLPIDEDISGNLLLGLRAGTGNFESPNTTAQTFEAAAFCAKYGVGRSLPQKKETEETETDSQLPPSPDWFEPKIYKGSTLP